MMPSIPDRTFADLQSALSNTLAGDLDRLMALFRDIAHPSAVLNDFEKRALIQQVTGMMYEGFVPAPKKKLVLSKA